MTTPTSHPATPRETPAPTPRRRPEPADWVVLAALLAAAALTSQLVLRAPPAVGQWQDDGVYLVTGKALADGAGYRRIDLPGSPWQTKYPILYPALLSLLWRAWPDFPANQAAVRALSVVAAAGAFWLAYLLMRRAWRLPPLVAGPAVIAAWLNPGWVALLQTPMSEPLFLLLTSAALWVGLDRSAAPLAPPSAPPHPARTWTGLAAAATSALLAGGAFLTRSVGVAVVGALVVSRLWQRRRRDALLALVVGSAAVAGWHGWRHWAIQSNRDVPGAAALGYELDYAAWRPRGVAEAVRIAGFNVPAVALALLTAVAPLDAGSVEFALRGAGGPLVLIAAMTLLVVLLIAVGVAATLRRQAACAHAFLALYLAMVLVWPFPPDRFVTAVLPFVYGLFFAGLATTLVSVLRLFDADGERHMSLRAALASGGLAEYARSSLAGWPTARWVVVALGAGLAYLGFTAISRVGNVVDPVAEREQAAFAEMLRTRTPQDAVIACGHGGYLHLLTGRRYVLFLPIDEPVELLYSTDRRWWQCGATFSDAEVERTRNWIRTRLEPYLRATGATHVVLKKDRSLFSVLFREYCESRTALFPPVAEDDVGSLHRFRGGT